MERRKLISVIGSGDLTHGDPAYVKAEKLGKALIDSGYRIITGGYGGVMEAASKGARSSERYREGDVIAVLKGHRRTDANIYSDIVIGTGIDLARNTIVANSDAVVAVGGGSGTLSEMAFAWQLGRMVIAYRINGWSGRLADRRIDDRKRNDIDDDRVYGADDEEDVIAILDTRLCFYSD